MDISEICRIFATSKRKDMNREFKKIFIALLIAIAVFILLGMYMATLILLEAWVSRVAAICFALGVPVVATVIYVYKEIVSE